LQAMLAKKDDSETFIFESNNNFAVLKLVQYLPLAYGS